MLPGKLAALCLCPALVATPVVIATHPKMRHAVAHIMHRAADRLDGPQVETAAAPCPSSFASAMPGSTGLGVPAETGLSGLSPQNLSALSPEFVPGGGSFGPSFGSPSVGGGFGGGAVPASTSVPGTGVVTTPTTVAGVTEPQNWALMITGFAATGILLRSKRLRRA